MFKDFDKTHFSRKYSYTRIFSNSYEIRPFVLSIKHISTDIRLSPIVQYKRLVFLDNIPNEAIMFYRKTSRRCERHPSKIDKVHKGPNKQIPPIITTQ